MWYPIRIEGRSRFYELMRGEQQAARVKLSFEEGQTAAHGSVCVFFRFEGERQAGGALAPGMEVMDTPTLYRF